MKTNKYILIGLTLAWALLIGAANSWAVPNLQIYSPDADYYDAATETWIINSYHYELWVVGAQLNVYDVKLAFAAPTDENGSITIVSNYGTSSPTSLTMMEYGAGKMTYDAYYDSYSKEDGVDPDPETYAFSPNGTPLMGSGKELPPHGVFPTSFYEYFIGDFGLGETVHNYIPGSDWNDTAAGEIKKFDIMVSGYTWVDIVAYDHVILGNNKFKYTKTPFSHDGSSTAVPEPGTMLLLGSGLLGLGLLRRRRKF